MSMPLSDMIDGVVLRADDEIDGTDDRRFRAAAARAYLGDAKARLWLSDRGWSVDQAYAVIAADVG